MNVKLEDLFKDSEDHKTHMFIQCCCCKRFRLDSEEHGEDVYSYIPLEELQKLEPYVISHTYCPDDVKKEREKLRQYQND